MYVVACYLEEATPLGVRPLARAHQSFDLFGSGEEGNSIGGLMSGAKCVLLSA